jgi:hypothetical protein
MQIAKQTTVSPPVSSIVPDDTTCAHCGRVCKNRHGLNIHQHTCLKKTFTDIRVDVIQKINQRKTPTTCY